LLSQLNEVVALGRPVLVGVSRKRFVTEAIVNSDTGSNSPIRADSLSIEDRDAGTAALNVVALMKGARIFRVHNVIAARRALDAAWAVVGRSWR
jgi:dihydropteroate synthase